MEEQFKAFAQLIIAGAKSEYDFYVNTPHRRVEALKNMGNELKALKEAYFIVANHEATEDVIPTDLTKVF